MTSHFSSLVTFKYLISIFKAVDLFYEVFLQHQGHKLRICLTKQKITSSYESLPILKAQFNVNYLKLL